MMKGLKILILLAVLAASLSSSGLALAQSSFAVDLGCWGVLNSAGDVQQTTSARLVYTVGAATAGSVSSSTARLNIGYVQDMRTLQFASQAMAENVNLAAEQGGAITRNPEAKFTIHLPLLSRFVRIVRFCSW
jgi:hypothetical protein